MRQAAVGSFLVLLSPVVALAYSTGSSVQGNVTVVNAGPGNQTDPHLSDSYAAYTSSLAGSTQIRYFKFLGGGDTGISNFTPDGVAVDFLSDVSGSELVFTRVDEEHAA